MDGHVAMQNSLAKKIQKQTKHVANYYIYNWL